MFEIIFEKLQVLMFKKKYVLLWRRVLKSAYKHESSMIQNGGL